uniref:ATP synthase F0 subunit 8 n=1 Tax=Nucula nucleus TaxID=47129 RepID=D3G6E8_9BIVA|nr:ATP synthase F0 subunit 8 [Nucula nucleus]
MPQLGPLNWLFLFILFWSSITLMTALIWWMAPQPFYFHSKNNSMKISHIWSW